MKLTRVTVRNFRSYVSKTDGKEACLQVSDGLNLLVGRNNCGKSNLLKSIALALEDSGGTKFDPVTDLPAQLAWTYPVITLSFKANASNYVEKTLLNYLDVYEKSAGTRRTYANQKEVHYRVKYTKTGRDEYFIARGAGNRRGDTKKLSKCIDQFKKCLRFIYLRSGENMKSFLAGTFHELLDTVLRENLKSQVNQAEEKRDKYIEGIRKDLLKPLSQHSLNQIRDVMSEITDITIRPYTPELSEALSQAEIRVKDGAETGILNKGTGVRGALLVSLLTYIAEHSRRSLILAVEEPESFLHPQAQEELRADLSRLGKRKDVSLLVTTHSPFLLDRTPSTLITPFSKNTDGVTLIGSSVTGEQSHVQAVSCLFGETITPSVLERIEPLKAKYKAVLFVEGYTDLEYIKIATQEANRTDLLDGIEIRFDGGAEKTALQALLFRQLAGSSVPSGVLLDWDDTGKNARKLLLKFNWEKKHFKSYKDWFTFDPGIIPVEAEDIFDDRLLKAFIKKHGDSVISEKTQYPNGAFHYGFTIAGKEAFTEFARKEAKKTDVGIWIKILEDWRKILGL